MSDDAPDTTTDAPSTSYTQEQLDAALAQERAKFAGFDDYRARAEAAAAVQAQLDSTTAEHTAALASVQDLTRELVAQQAGMPLDLLPTTGTREELENWASAQVAWADQRKAPTPHVPAPGPALPRSPMSPDAGDTTPTQNAVQAIKRLVARS